MDTAALITSETQDRVCIIRINRPEKKNALTAEMYEALIAAFTQAEADPQIRAMLITGSEIAFSAGNDIADFMANPPLDDSAPVMRLLRLLTELRKPMVAAVCGPAVGIGTTLLLHCDLVACGEQTSFAVPFVSLGLCAEGGSSLLLAQRVGAARANEWLLLGEPFDAHTAAGAGLVNIVLPNGKVFDHALAWAHKLASKPPQALLGTRELIRRASQSAARSTIAAEAALFKQLLKSEEAGEAFAAFVEKRKPDFSRF
ncbi:enoyl-CoA hydratase [Niveibacterium sp. 24ML]|uniref:enoyl-CoA hydratase n=1 Tax=Niveibacterium sp. 24ML TaxID=2985512 RepID=UPI00226D7B33|nr:enoyl-CoA hydratase [Niveibacterium sp. 24ML]MCX9156676.1 enoyl-CoA hydratase [Niveibacterium sp. 24ML]